MGPLRASCFRYLATGLRPSYASRQISTGTNSFPPMCTGLGQSGSGEGTLVPKGKIYQKEPVKVALDQGQSYKWCSCGASKKQPFCDGRPLCQPVTFKARESKEYMFCNCKQTNKQPFCDGSHKNL